MSFWILPVPKILATHACVHLVRHEHENPHFFCLLSSIISCVTWHEGFSMSTVFVVVHAIHGGNTKRIVTKLSSATCTWWNVRNIKFICSRKNSRLLVGAITRVVSVPILTLDDSCHSGVSNRETRKICVQFNEYENLMTFATTLMRFSSTSVAPFLAAKKLTNFS